MQQRQQRLTCPRLPLAVYREIVAHLRQVSGVQAGLIPQETLPDRPFDYQQSQVSSLWLKYEDDLDASARQQLQEILDYYAQCYGTWQRENVSVRQV